MKGGRHGGRRTGPSGGCDGGSHGGSRTGRFASQYLYNGLIGQETRGKQSGSFLRGTPLRVSRNGNIGIDSETTGRIGGIASKSCISTETGERDKGRLHDER